MQNIPSDGKASQAYLQSTEGLLFPVEIIGEKTAWGNARRLVRPIGGKGEKWVDISRLMFELPAPTKGEIIRQEAQKRGIALIECKPAEPISFADLQGMPEIKA